MGRQAQARSDGAAAIAAARPRRAPSAERRRDLAKAVFDRAFAAAMLVILAPVMAAVAVFIWVADGRPVIFAHRRVGKDGREFSCLKFRTMVRDGDRRLEAVLAIDPIAREEWESARKLHRDPRVPRWGAILRKLSLDELPQLVNILRGEMSVVGPRPVTRAEMAHYGPQAAAYQSVRPGLTGPWQVGGRNDLSYSERVALDAAYAARHSLAGDLAIILRTIPAVLLGRGAS